MNVGVGGEERERERKQRFEVCAAQRGASEMSRRRDVACSIKGQRRSIAVFHTQLSHYLIPSEKRGGPIELTLLDPLE